MWNHRRTELLVVALLVASVAIVFARVAHHAFIDFDDPGYVFDNAHVRAGLTWDGARWAFTTGAQSTWHPLTWLSHMLDAQLFGVDGRCLGLPAAGWHHLVNVGLHAASALLLFAFLRSATGAVWRSAMVAALFALHPLHVESVAWASERKDVLSAFFGFACLLAYVHYARSPNAARFAAVFALLALGLMAKSMLVTWPFVMLLLDVWPLARPEPFGRRLLEKVPFFALAAAVSVLTYHFEQPAMHLMSVVPLAFRAQIALAACFSYIAKTFWPHPLAILYPYPSDISAGLLAAAGFALIALACVAAACARRRPYATVGILWFLGTLVPVIGLVQVGLHAMADRFTYIPLVGVFIALVWGAADAGVAWPRVQRVLPAASVAILVACAALSRRQLAYWQDTETLFRHACDVTEKNGWAHRILGTALLEERRPGEAVVELRAALSVWPDDPVARNNLGSALLACGRADDALREYREAARLDPHSAVYRRNVERARARLGLAPSAPERAADHDTP